MNELELRQLFKNRFDCFADTWEEEFDHMVEGEVIPAMTEDRFIEILKEANLLSNPIVKIPKSRGCCSECGEGYDNDEEWLYNTECELCGHPIPEHLIVKKPNLIVKKPGCDCEEGFRYTGLGQMQPCKKCNK